MIKKILVCLCIMACFVPKVVYAENENSVTLAPNAQSAVLMEPSTKQILYASNENEALYPASTTKIMTLILMFEAINKGSLKWDDVLTASAYAASMGGTQIYLKEGEQMSLYDLFQSICLSSANDSCVVVGERIAGSIEGFVKMMNEKAKQLNLVNTNFMNATGLHDDNHYTCALDLALMGAYLIEIGGEDLLKMTSTTESYIRQDSAQKFWLVNTNKLLRSYDGVDGLKTGYTKEAGYCIVTTAKRDGLRLIAVVMKEKEPAVRNQEIAGMLDYGFSLYENVTLFKSEEVIETFDVKQGKAKTANLISEQDIVYVHDRNSTEEVTHTITYMTQNAPLKRGDVVARLDIIKSEIVVASYNLTVEEDVDALSFLEKFFSFFTQFA